VEVVREYERFGVLLADKQRARLFVFELGELLERSELVDELPRDYDHRGERERGDTQHHVEALAATHLRHAADAAWRAYREVGFEHLTIGAPDAIAGQLESCLHPYLRERLAPRIGVAVTAGTDEIRRAAREVEAHVERAREMRLVEQLRDDLGRGRRAVAGIDPVLEALAQRRVDRLLVSHGFSESGWRCERCGTLTTVGRSCRRCGDDMEAIDDVVEEAVEEALSQSCHVDVCVANADLDCLGRVGALLRY
jgi:peptide subunit release factor 1 (eRF1)